MSSWKTVFVAVLCLLGGTPIEAASWRFSNPRPHGNNILDLAIRDGEVWQLGDRGRIYTSKDLDRWMPHETDTSKSLRSIAFFGTNVFISSQDGTILHGPNANSLTEISLGTTDWLEGIAASQSTLVAVGDNGAIHTSNAGNSWTRRGNFSTWLRSVTYGGGQFVCVGEDGFIASSDTGETWEQQIAGVTAHLNKVAWLQDRFWIVGEGGTVLTNNFRMEFVPMNTGVTNALFTVSGSSNEIVVAGDSVALLWTPQTASWTPQADSDSPLLAPLWPYYSSLWDGRLFLLGGRTGMIVEGFRTNANAPLNWYSSMQPTRSWLWSATRAPGFYAAVGAKGTIVTSEDGVEWARENVPATATNEVLLGIGGNTNVLLAAGSNGTLLRSENVYTNTVSTNSTGEAVTNQVSLFGLRWDRVNAASPVDLQGVAATENVLIVTGGNGSILTSSDGKDWNVRESGVTSFLSGATSWPEGFVVVGASGVILTSLDGATWTRRISGVQSWVYSVRYVGGILIAVGEDGLILTSTDGIQWQPRSSGTSEWLNDVTFANGIWQIAAGGGRWLLSTDGIAWSTVSAITSKSLYGAATDGQRVIMVGLEGVILREKLPASQAPVNFVSYDIADQNSLYLFGGTIDQEFFLQESESITGPWSTVEYFEFSNPDGVILYERQNQSATGSFFRTRSP